ncbi:DUF1269 domain-containing protein [Immundisolibacter cernigliae]|jgi:uncharacterized membrane protein|uniref:DUF1269 domain-containing protein n=1 Tax=Immundisolibacter cernigliae TaxID=1810504 RepID=A0A1B1YSX7_9GAMM|nr:DUF1269 domain-containing protein [Immundisolibacter cernigliae]ANX03938.1 hypothetical protein PG2T_06855 [Immundisolibacter cernigliae]
MKTLIAVIYKHQPDAAAKTLDRLRDLEEEYLIDLDDAVVVRRNEKGRLTLQQSVNLAASGAWGGSFWGILIGLIFAGPLGMVVGGAAGAGIGALSGYFADFGINDDFIRALSKEVEPCCSALFVLARSMTTDKVIAALEGTGGQIIKTSLPADIEARLQQAVQTNAAAIAQSNEEQE